jgi:hypothetical protein
MQWRTSDTKQLIITVVGGVLSTVAAAYVMNRSR